MLVERVQEQAFALAHALRPIELRIAFGGQPVELVAAPLALDDVARERLGAQIRGVTQACDRANLARFVGAELGARLRKVVRDRVEHVLIRIEARIALAVECTGRRVHPIVVVEPHASGRVDGFHVQLHGIAV